MRNLLFAALAATLSTGCSGNEEIWLFFTSADSDVTASYDIEENYINWQVAEDPGGPASEWTYTDTTVASDELGFGQIVKVSGDDDAVLILQGVAMPGVKQGGVWTFSWEDFSEDTFTAEHSSGYSYTEVERSATTYTVTMDIKGGTASGMFSIRNESMDHWTESDSWDAAVQNSGDTPVNNYLENTDGNFIENDASSVDCAADPCMLMVTQSSQISTPFTAELTHFTDEDAFAGVQGAGNP